MRVRSLPVWWHKQVKERAVCLVLLMTFLLPLLTFSSWIRLDCIAWTSLGLHTLHLEVEWVWIHWLQVGDIPQLQVAWSYTDTTKGHTVLPLLMSYDSPNISLDLALRKSHWTLWRHKHHFMFAWWITWIWVVAPLLDFSSVFSGSFLGFLMRASGSSMTGV